ncbi:MAG: hypothetical protein P4L33_00720 [Capsulimonadaceae bacterium]|nr:hypothetical protein [Capsulimonadaceae bacterium]
MKTVKHRFHFIGLAALIGPIGFALSPFAVPARGDAAPQIWRPAEGALKLLGAETKIDAFSIRPPLNYKFVSMQQGPNMAYGWTGAPHPNGILPALYFTIAAIPPDDQTNLTLEDGVAAQIRSQRKHEPDAIFSKPEYGTVNGLATARFYWKGHDRLNLMRHGLCYLTISGKMICMAGAQDIEPYSASSLPIMEAAIQTFRKPSEP